jgi:phosphopantetheinyl transferase
VENMPLWFNIAHTHGHGLIVLSTAGEVGVDIERRDRNCDHHLLARRVFTPEEREDWSVVPEAEKKHAFLTTWVAKEAYTKATGEGLQRGFSTFAMSEIPVLHWLDIGEDYIAALATPDPSAPTKTSLAYRLHRIGGD